MPLLIHRDGHRFRSAGHIRSPALLRHPLPRRPKGGRVAGGESLVGIFEKRVLQQVKLLQRLRRPVGHRQRTGVEARGRAVEVQLRVLVDAGPLAVALAVVAQRNEALLRGEVLLAVPGLGDHQLAAHRPAPGLAGLAKVRLVELAFQREFVNVGGDAVAKVAQVGVDFGEDLRGKK